MVLVDDKGNMDLDTEEVKILHKKLFSALENYRKTMTYLAGDAPIGVLCLPKTTETILYNAGISRVYDLFGRDLTEIKGIGKVRIRDLTTRLDEFISML